MAGTLFIVGTPIGNLKDITLRAIEVLKDSDVICCEDTRVSLKLLSYYGIKKPLISYYKHKERESSQKIIELLNEGKNISLITDAGMPLVSDPGAILVDECRKNNLNVTIVPGPSAVISAVCLSGIQTKGFTFLGFLPEKNKDKEEYVKDYLYLSAPVVFYSSPHNINSDGEFLYKMFGDRKVYICKELTKMYENVDIQQLKTFNVINPRGEYVLIVMQSEEGSKLNELSVPEQVRHYMQSGLTKKDAIKRTAQDRGVDKNTIYSAVLDL